MINYSLPEDSEDYIHRIGRTGRAGASGISISFACEDDSFQIPGIEEAIGNKLNCVHPNEALLISAPPFSRKEKPKIVNHSKVNTKPPHKNYRRRYKK